MIEPVVHVVDDDLSVRRSLERLIRSAGFRVETHSSAAEFLSGLHPDGPSCLVLDVKMPEVSGTELQRRLAEMEIHMPVIFITGHGTIPMSVQAMKMGAVDFLQKPFEDGELLEAIGRALEQDRRTRRQEGEMAQIRQRIEALSARELQVLGLLVAGLLNKQIAFELGTSEKTIKFHRAHIMKKMQAGSFADLVRMAHRAGIGLEP